MIMMIMIALYLFNGEKKVKFWDPEIIIKEHMNWIMDYYRIHILLFYPYRNEHAEIENVDGIIIIIIVKWY